ncbi:Fasciclin-like arabinogalactan protein [Pseudocercospora fuligena]|uniref:Fasciclin-like arabinogalactan protein n=1 Tax=Pseudocercospora fuligena TaxID=685502 RepID=A0A8H6RMB2_9PEZI|nr:Fasciclin-like arabinogalactan protein [Pseudocercospora fuligena]
MFINNIIALLLSSALASAQQDLVSVLQSQSDLSTLTAVVPKLPEVQEWIGSASNLTLLLPTNDAITSLPSDSWEGKIFSEMDIDGIAAILSLHVINGVYKSTDFKDSPTFVKSVLTDIEPIGGKPVANVTGGQNVGLVLNGSDATCLSGYLSTSKVLEADIPAGNNLIIHKIDQVLRLPLNVSATAEKLELTGALGALNATGLTDTADTIADLTIFIPSNEAFEAIESVVANTTMEMLTGILSYHAIAGSVLFSSDLSNTTVPSLTPGMNLTVTVLDDGTVMIDDAKVITPNVILSNGVAHVIDSVLMPSMPGMTAGGYGPPMMPGGGGGNMTNATTTPMPYTGEAAGQLAKFSATAGVVLLAVMLAL